MSKISFKITLDTTEYLRENPEKRENQVTDAINFLERVCDDSLSEEIDYTVEHLETPKVYSLIQRVDHEGDTLLVSWVGKPTVSQVMSKGYTEDEAESLLTSRGCLYRSSGAEIFFTIGASGEALV